MAFPSGIPLPAQEVEVVLVPIGDVKRDVLETLRNGLEREMRMRFSVAPGKLEPGTQMQVEEDASLYDSKWILHRFESRYRNDRASGVRGHLGVTAMELHAGGTEKRRTSGISTPGYGVLSLAGPFAPELDPSRIEKGILRMAIRLVFGILGVSPCRTPDCPYSRGSSPPGARREDPGMCSDCRERLERIPCTMKETGNR